MTEPAGDPQSELDLVNGLLSRMLTLSAALAGGGIFLLTDWTLGIAIKAAVAICLASFACAWRGLEASPAATKRRWFRMSALAVFVALALTLVGISLRW